MLVSEIQFDHLFYYKTFDVSYSNVYLLTVVTIATIKDYWPFDTDLTQTTHLFDVSAIIVCHSEMLRWQVAGLVSTYLHNYWTEAWARVKCC